MKKGKEWMKWMKWKNRLDEMQEQKLLKLEHNGFWIAYFGLAVMLFVQILVYEPEEYHYLLGEWLLFMCLSIYMVGGCIRNGIWDRRLSPTPKVNLIGSLIGGVICGVIQFAISYRSYQKFIGSMAAGIFVFFFVSVLCYAVMSFFVAIYKKRVEKLENVEEESEDDTK